jgi:hypothetical protein
MSLINEALKKAQSIQTRAPASAASAAAAPAAAPKLRTKPAQVVPPPFVPTQTTTTGPVVPRRPVGTSKAVLALGAGLFVVALGVLGFAMFMLFGRPAQPTTVVRVQPDPAEVSSASANATQSADDSDKASAAGATNESTATATSAASDANAAAAAGAAAPVAVVAPAPTPPAPVAPPKRINHPNARVQDFVNKLQVSGIRSGEHPRVLMNDRVYAIGDLVNADLDVHLTHITQDQLEFEDAEGNTYTLPF